MAKYGGAGEQTYATRISKYNMGRSGVIPTGFIYRETQLGGNRMSRQIITIGLTDALNNMLFTKFSAVKIEIGTFADINEITQESLYRESFLVVIDTTKWTLYETQFVVRSIRRKSYIPILLLTSFESVAPLLEDGADICLSPNEDWHTILAHAMALIRRSVIYDRTDTVASEPDSIRRGELKIEPKYHRVTLAGEEVVLQRREFRLLSYFANNPGIVLTTDQIAEVLWPNEEVFDRNIAYAIARLRRKLRDDSRDPTYIETIRGVGYRFLPKE